MRLKGLIVMTLASVAVAGCTRVPREAGFGDVKQIVADRGVEQVHWNQGTAVDREAEQAVRSLLQKELTAESAVQIALLNNRNLQATYEDLGVAQADVVQAGLLRNPVFNADFKFAEGGGGTKVDLSVTQDFIDLFYIPLRKRVAEASFEQAKLQVAGAILDLAGQTRVAFVDFQAAEQTRELRKHVADATGASYDLAKRLLAAGNTTDLAVANERSLHEQSKLDLANAEVDVVQAREQLNSLMGVWGIDTQWKAAARLPEVVANETQPSNVEQQAVERSLQLSMLRSQITANAERLGLQRSAGLIPEAEVGVAGERETDGQWEIGPAFAVPIPLFDQGQAAVARAKAELRRSRAQYFAAAIELRSQARFAYARSTAARSRVLYYRDVILPLRREITERTQLQYNAMQIGPFQLIQAKQAEIESGVEYISALREYWGSNIQLRQIANGRTMDMESGRSSTSARSGTSGRRNSTGGH